MKTKNQSNIDDQKAKTIYIALICILSIASISRIYHYINPKNLWLDESLIAMAIYKTSLIDLIQGKYVITQSCPFLFGFYNKILAITTNYSPNILYFTPTIVGILLILFIARFCIKYDGILYTFICITIISVCKMPLYYSTEFKQYIFESVVTIFLLSNVINDIRNNNNHNLLNNKYPLYFSISLLVSSTSIFISTGLSFAIFIFLLKKNDFSFKNLCIKFIHIYKFFIIFFILYYIVYLKNTTSGMYIYWKEFFFPISLSDWPDYIKTVLWPIMTGMFQIKGFLSKIFTKIIFIFFPIGIYTIYRRNKFELLTFISPLLIASLAAFKIYPPGHPGMIGARLSLYLYPIIILISGHGILNLLKLIIRNISLRQTRIIFTIFVIGIALINISFVRTGLGWQQSYELFEKVYKEKSCNDIIFVYSPTRYALDYWLAFNKRALEYSILDRKYFRSEKDKIDDNFSKNFISNKDNIYILYSHHDAKDPDVVERWFKSKGYKVETFYDIGAVLQKIYHVCPDV